ncbi:glutathione S-transferase kappa 1-like isoform X2 [Daphnia pulicaria]|uniref:glutathione S-transferase kappa 1-like isoform X2 n=1 Tax=Daphnia pulicaria TaxID=35523 RepID=UPI001EEAC801|nr:glutathione S-transferase kappa 1-like isoform X2 [Daphnia pulicaria]
MAALIRTKVELFYDVVSPYSWFGFEALCRYRPHWKMDLVLRPFFLGGVMNETGNRPPMMVPSKGLYMQKDLLRNAAYFGIPLKLIEDPFNVMIEKGTLRAQRFLTAIAHEHPEHVEGVSRELWTRIWSRGEDIVENESLRLAAKAANMKDFDIQKCFKLMDDSTVKLALKKSTEDAIEHGNITLNIYALIILGFWRTYHCCSLKG